MRLVGFSGSATGWAAVAFALSMSAAVGIWYTTKSSTEQKARAQFETAATRIVDAVRDQLSDDRQILWGGMGLFAATSAVSREQWRAYVRALKIPERLPGIQRLGFAKIIGPDEKAAHIDEQHAQGYPDYTIWPEGERGRYAPIVYLDPSDEGSRRAFGYDMLSDPVRQAAMDDARDSGDAVISGKVDLVVQAGSDAQSGFLMYLPVYRSGAPADNVAQRRAALVGYVFSPFRMRELITRGVLAREAADAGLAFEIYDGSEVQLPALLFRSSRYPVDAAPDPASTLVATYTFGDHPWTFRFAALSSFVPNIRQRWSFLVLAGGFLISLLSGAVVHTLSMNRAQAVEAHRRLLLDMARREHAENQLRENELKFRSLFSNNPLPMLAYDRQTLQFVEVNDAAVAKYGYSSDEFKRMRAVDLRPPEDVPRFLRELSGDRPRFRHAGEWRHVLRDGSIIDVEITAHDMELSGRDVTLVAAQDITRSKRAQEALVESEQLARGIIETALDAFVQLDEVGSIIEWNGQAEAVFGWSRQEAVGQSLSALISPADPGALNQLGLARFVQDGEGHTPGRRLELASRRRDGREIKVELSITALRRRSGYVFNAFVRDLTDKIIAEEQLRQAQKLDAVGQLTGGVAHDFNNILTVITGTIEILAAGVADRPQLAVITRMIDDAARRGAALTKQLLAFARKQPLQPRPTDINGLVVDAAKLLRPTLGEQVEIESRLEEGAWPVLVDPSQLTTTLVNLALNARDAMPHGGRLTLETGNVVLDESFARFAADVRPGPYVMIAVTDTGAGIPSAIRDKVFEPFFTTKGVGKGTGLGLSMVYGFVKQSDGHIKIDSEEGRGTSIKIYLPRSAESTEATTAAEPSISVARGRETILVVEDDELVRNYVIAQLESLGYRTIAAKNAAHALALLDRGEVFDLLFTDVIMPGAMNGRQLADEVVRRRPSVRVLFTSGYSEDAILHHGRLDPGVLLLAKPYRKLDLAHMVRTALDVSESSAFAARRVAVSGPA